ncbi:MAG: protein translocase subunit SecF, partial [Treponema sp.]|nr:protein translocase subunit SecF [Treponema sp.]
MKKNYTFSKAFLPCYIFSALLITAGIVSIATRKINLGLDFQPGLIEEVRIAKPAMQVTYSGAATVSLDASNTGVDVIISGLGAENETRTFTYGQNPTISSLCAALNSIDGISAKVLSAGDADSYGIFTNNAETSRLSSDKAFMLYVSSSQTDTSIDELRSVLAGQDVQLKELGTSENRSYQI